MYNIYKNIYIFQQGHNTLGFKCPYNVIILYIHTCYGAYMHACYGQHA